MNNYERYDITDYLKDDKELQKAIIEELLKDNAALKAENEKLKKEMKNNKSAYEVELGTYNVECGNLLEENKQLFQTLQEIKAIAEKELSYDMVGNEHRHYRNYDIIRHLINKQEEE